MTTPRDDTTTTTHTTPTCTAWNFTAQDEIVTTWSSCGTDHGTGTTASGDGVTVFSLVPESQVESLRETVSDLYRQLGDEQRRVAALEIALRDLVGATVDLRGFLKGYAPERFSEQLLPRVDAPLEAARLLLRGEE